MKRNSNILSTLLRLLNVKHTNTFTATYFNEHPHRNSIYGLSRMISYYGIENEGLKVKNKDILPEMDTPFVAHVRDDFAIVEQVGDQTVSFIDKGKNEIMDIETFKKNWSGVVLLMEPDEKSIEPNYAENRKKELLVWVKYMMLTVALGLLLGALTYRNITLFTWGFVSSLLINLTGLYVSFLLLLKQTKTHSSQADRLCSLLGEQSDCSHILDSDAAKFLGFSWSEIGLGYFFTNALIIIALPSLYIYVAMLNVFTLPYTLWSVWYQKYRAKQWCPLCLVVQCLLWVLFSNHLLLGYLEFTSVNILHLLIVGSLYISTVVLINLFTSIWIKSKEREKLRYELNNLKSNEEIFNSLMKTRDRYNTGATVCSSIFLGELEAKNTLTIVSNPHCNPCAKLHERISELLKDENLGFRIQYILTSFGERGDKVNQLIISKYFEMNPLNFAYFLDEWYKHGRHNEENFIKKYMYMESPESIGEFRKQKDWVQVNKINATPTILYNGIKLPQEIYKIEDVYLFTHMSLK